MTFIHSSASVAAQIRSRSSRIRTIGVWPRSGAAMAHHRAILMPLARHGPHVFDSGRCAALHAQLFTSCRSAAVLVPDDIVVRPSARRGYDLLQGIKNLRSLGPASVAATDFGKTNDPFLVQHERGRIGRFPRRILDSSAGEVSGKGHRGTFRSRRCSRTSALEVRCPEAAVSCLLQTQVHTGKPNDLRVQWVKLALRQYQHC